LQQVQTSLSPSSGSLHDDIEQFFNDVNQLAAQPNDTTQRTVVITDAQTLAGEFNSLNTQLGQIRTNLDAQMNTAVTNINSLAQQIAQLNDQIRVATARGQSPNDQLDQRDQLINQLAQDINVQVIPADLGQVNVLAAGVPIVVDNQSASLQYSLDSSNQGQVTLAGSSTPLPVTGGQTGA
jgi:flagellar hook-associated protein 1 FlgK